MDNWLLTLGLARKAGALAAGEEPAGEACRARQARCVLLASDAAENSARRAARFAQEGEVPLLSLPGTKAELGSVLGRRSCAILAVTDSGLAAAVLEQLAALDPAYRPAADALQAEAEALRAEARTRKQKTSSRSGKKRSAARNQSSNNGGGAH